MKNLDTTGVLIELENMNLQQLYYFVNNFGKANYDTTNQETEDKNKLIRIFLLNFRKMVAYNTFIAEIMLLTTQMNKKYQTLMITDSKYEKSEMSRDNAGIRTVSQTKEYINNVIRKYIKQMKGNQISEAKGEILKALEIA